MTPPTDLSARRGGRPSGTNWKNWASGVSGGVGACMASNLQRQILLTTWLSGASLSAGAHFASRGQTIIRNVSGGTRGHLPPIGLCPGLDLPHSAQPCRPHEWVGKSGRLLPTGPCPRSGWRHHGLLCCLRESLVSP